jgi:dihydrodipicolinate synthase/N-acetylneuraminate lyase
MRRMERLRGVFVPLITPMFDDTRLDLDGVGRLACRILAAPGVDGLFGLGATGEFMALSYHERKAIVEIFGELPDRRKPITVNVGGLPRDKMLELSVFALQKGLDAVAFVIADDVQPEPEAVYTYLEPIITADIPFLLYWSPSYSQHRASLALIERLLASQAFVGLKDSSRDMVMFTELCTRYGEELSIFQGVEMLHLSSLAVGSAGVVGGGLNLYPALPTEISTAFAAGEWKQARALQQRMNQSWAQLNAQRAFRSVCKHYWRRQGIVRGVYCRVGPNLDFDERAAQDYAQLAAI